MILKKGSEIELEVTSTAFKGKGVARHDGMAIFIPNTAPGDRVLARIIKKKKSYSEARLVEVLVPSPDRITPLCRHAGVCGGCNWQHLPYPRQLELKREHVRDHIERIGGLDPAIVQPIVGCDRPFYYRNKMEYSFSTRRWLSWEEIRSGEEVEDSGFAAGLHAPGRFDKILDLQECHLQDLVSFRILDEVRSFCIQNGIPAYDTFRRSGFMRNLIVRTSRHSGEVMAILVTRSGKAEWITAIRDHLITAVPEITTIVHHTNDSPGPVSRNPNEQVLHGTGSITEAIGDYRFRIDALSFFQTNTEQAGKLYQTALEFASPRPEDLVFDLYCGVGTLSLFFSRKVRKVVGIELVEEAVENAGKNAVTNGVENVEFVRGDMKDTFNTALLEEHGRPDCIVTDPPRAGMHPDVVRQLIELRVPRLVYVSCEPSTLARDLKELSSVYRVEEVRPVDMFPQTYHIEAVAKLRLAE